MTEKGIWRGGARPFGYRLVHNGRHGKLNRPLFDLEVDEAESDVVREIFNAVCHEGIGTHTLANDLNRKYPNPEKVWTAMTIRTMLRNPLYTGRFHMNDTMSEPNESLRIVSDYQFDFAGHVLGSRITRKTTTKIDEETGEKRPSMAQIYGGVLLSGILYCGHCGHKLVGTYHTKIRNGEPYRRPVYRCYYGSTKAHECHGPRTYSATILDTATLSTVREYFGHFKSRIDSVWKEQARLQMVKRQDSKVKELSNSLAKLQTRKEALKDEIIKSIEGTSSFDPETIKELIARNDAALIEAATALQRAKSEQGDSGLRLQVLMEQYRNINDWAEVFDKVDADEKKMILARLIEKIEVSRDNRLTIHFYITMEEFDEAIRAKGLEGPSVQIEESEHLIPSIAN